MLNWFARRMKEARENEQGFTLIELLVVVIIIGILAAIAIPTFLNQRAKAQDSEATSAARNAASQMGSISTACQGKYVMPTACTADISFANVSTEADGGDPALAKYAAAPYNGVVTVAADDKSFTVKVTSRSGKNAIFSSTAGEVTIS